MSPGDVIVNLDDISIGSLIVCNKNPGEPPGGYIRWVVSIDESVWYTYDKVMLRFAGLNTVNIWNDKRERYLLLKSSKLPEDMSLEEAIEKYPNKLPEITYGDLMREKWLESLCSGAARVFADMGIKFHIAISEDDKETEEAKV